MDFDGAYSNSGHSTREVGQFIVEREKIQRKLTKVQQRRDHYARLYYRTLAELDETKWELSRAKHKIRELQQTAHDKASHSGTTSPDSGTSLSPHHWRPVPHPKLRPAFTQSLTFSQGDTLSQLDTPPAFHRQLSLPPNASSASVSSFSAFQGHKSPKVELPVYSQSNTQLPVYREALTDCRVCHECLSGLEMLDLLSFVSSPKCTITSLEVANSQLGEPQAMRVFCEDLVKNTSITSLSLPDNGISSQSLTILLEAVQKCSQLRELLLRRNLIGVDCAETIKLFLSHTTLDSLVLTGNEIEHHSHLLSSELPGEFSMEYSEGWDSNRDSGVATRGLKRNSLDCMNV